MRYERVYFKFKFCHIQYFNVFSENKTILRFYKILYFKLLEDLHMSCHLINVCSSNLTHFLLIFFFKWWKISPFMKNKLLQNLIKWASISDHFSDTVFGLKLAWNCIYMVPAAQGLKRMVVDICANPILKTGINLLLPLLCVWCNLYDAFKLYASKVCQCVSV